MTTITKTGGQLAYEHDVRQRPTRFDGTPRPTWEELGPIARERWDAACRPLPAAALLPRP